MFGQVENSLWDKSYYLGYTRDLFFPTVIIFGQFFIVSTVENFLFVLSLTMITQIITICVTNSYWQCRIKKRKIDVKILVVSKCMSRCSNTLCADVSVYSRVDNLSSLEWFTKWLIHLKVKATENGICNKSARIYL